jgi:hypothetical protein
MLEGNVFRKVLQAPARIASLGNILKDGGHYIKMTEIYAQSCGDEKSLRRVDGKARRVAGIAPHYKTNTEDAEDAKGHGEKNSLWKRQNREPVRYFVSGWVTHYQLVP